MLLLDALARQALGRERVFRDRVDMLAETDDWLTSRLSRGVSQNKKKDSKADSKCNKIYYLIVRGNVESGRSEDRRAQDGAGDKMAGVLDGEREVSVCAKQNVS